MQTNSFIVRNVRRICAIPFVLLLLGVRGPSQAPQSIDAAIPSPRLREVTIVRYPSILAENDPRQDYDRAVLELILEKTRDKWGPYKLQGINGLQQSRAFAGLKVNQLVDAIPTVTNAARERDFRAIRYDFHRGLMGVKLFLVPANKVKIFAKMRVFADLLPYVAGQGHDWPDVEIYRDAGIKVITSPIYDGLFKMLASNRIDFFPRSVPEIWEEEKLHAADGIVIEPTLALIYPAPAYIFVNKPNEKLAARFDEGFEIAMRDGSFNKLFFAKNSENIAKANMKNRRIFYMPNTALPPSYKDFKPDLSFLFNQ